jgi:hypothetical protein
MLPYIQLSCGDFYISCVIGVLQVGVDTQARHSHRDVPMMVVLRNVRTRGGRNAGVLRVYTRHRTWYRVRPLMG